jgi:cytochrome b561
MPRHQLLQGDIKSTYVNANETSANIATYVHNYMGTYLYMTMFVHIVSALYYIFFYFCSN